MTSTTIVPLKRNMGSYERMASVAVGSFLIYQALSGRRNIMKAVAGGILALRGASGFCPVYALMNIDTSEALKVTARARVKVKKPRREVYGFWRKLDNLPLFMKHLESITMTNNLHSYWKVRLPGDLGNLAWTSRITSDLPGEHITWKSLEGSAIEHEGTVRFSDAGKKSTVISVEWSYKAPAGTPGQVVSHFLNPMLEKVIKEEIKNFKKYIE